MKLINGEENKISDFSIVSTGLDIELVERFKNMNCDIKKAVLKHIFTKEERDYALSRSNPDQHLCVRFAAKEATCKALSQLGMVCFPNKEIAITNDDFGRPSLTISKIIDKNSLNHMSFKALVSLTHTEIAAAAIVIILRRFPSNLSQS